MAHLTEGSIKKLPPDGRLIGDDRTANLYVRKNRDGSVVFVHKTQKASVWRERVVGRAPRMSLDRARAEVARLRAEDSGQVVMSWGAAAQTYLEQREKQVQTIPLRNIERILLGGKDEDGEYRVPPTHFGELRSIKLDMPNLQDVVTRIVLEYHRETPETAVKMLAHAKRFTHWAAMKKKVDHDPLHLLDKKDVFGKYRAQPKSRILTDAEIRMLWRDESASATVLWFQLLTGCRVSEALRFKPEQVGKDNIWEIPITKSGRPHRVPLSRQALRLIEDGFPPEISFFGLLHWASKHYQFRSHDCRRTAATRMRTLGASGETAHYVLNHAREVLDATYLHHDAVPEARVWLQRLGDHLERVALA